MKRTRFFFPLVVLTGLGTLLAACSDDPATNMPSGSETAREYAFWVEAGNDANKASFILTTADIMKDSVISPANNQGIDITGTNATFSYFYKGKYYLSNDGTRLSQCVVTDDGQFKETGNLAFGYSFWLGKVLESESTDNEMVFTHTNSLSGFAENTPSGRVERKPIYFLDTDNMTITKVVTARIPYLDYTVYQDNGEVDSTNMHVTSMERRGDKIFFGYDFYNAKWGMANDSTYIYVCDYPSMANGKVLKDGHGHTSSHWSSPRRAFFDDDKNLYFIIINTDGRQGLIRIKNNETEIDPDYFYDLGELNLDSHWGGAPVQELGHGLTYIKPCIIDAPNKRLVRDMRTVTGQIDPSQSTQSFVEDGKLYDVYKTADSRWYVFQYDPATDKVTRGIQIDGGLTWVDMINRLK